MPHHFEAWMLEQMRYIRLAPGEKIIDAQYVVTVRQQALAKMRAEKTGSAGDQNFVQWSLHCDEPRRIARHT